MKPIEIADALEIKRPHTGDLAGVALYRLFRLVAMEDILGPGASAISYYAGKKLGKALEMRDLDQFLRLCEHLRIGEIAVPVFGEEHVHVDVRECVTCAGIPPVGRMLCHFEGGLVAGVFERVLGKTVQAKEVTCIGGFGHETCGFDLKIAG